MGVAVGGDPGGVAQVGLDGAHVDAGTHQLGPAEMAKIVKTDLDAEAAGETAEALADRIWLHRHGAGRIGTPPAPTAGQDVSLGQNLDPGDAAAAFTRSRCRARTARAKGSSATHRS